MANVDNLVEDKLHHHLIQLIQLQGCKHQITGNL